MRPTSPPPPALSPIGRRRIVKSYLPSPLGGEGQGEGENVKPAIVPLFMRTPINMVSPEKAPV
jgi:hypothetical protein